VKRISHDKYQLGLRNKAFDNLIFLLFQNKNISEENLAGHTIVEKNIIGAVHTAFWQSICLNFFS